MCGAIILAKNLYNKHVNSDLIQSTQYAAGDFGVYGISQGVQLKAISAFMVLNGLIKGQYKMVNYSLLSFCFYAGSSSLESCKNAYGGEGESHTLFQKVSRILGSCHIFLIGFSFDSLTTKVAQRGRYLSSNHIQSP